MTEALRPPFIYYGGKQRVAAAIAALLPEHRHYVEPFAGSLAVLLAKPVARMETVNDLDGDLMVFWRVLRDRPDELQRVCALTPHSRGEMLAARQRPAELDDLERARRVWILLSQHRTGTLRTNGWRYHADGAGSATAMSGYLDAYVGRMAAAAARLASVSLECRPALDVIHSYGAHRSNLLYIDPPYLASTRSGTNYRHEMPHLEQHEELARALHACTATVVLSGYPSEVYDRDLYPDWYRHELPASTSQGGTGKARTEVLWSNRPLALPGTGEVADLFTDLDHSDEAPSSGGETSTTTRRCSVCRMTIAQPSTGRPRTTCSDACRARASRARRRTHPAA